MGAGAEALYSRVIPDLHPDCRFCNSAGIDFKDYIQPQPVASLVELVPRLGNDRSNFILVATYILLHGDLFFETPAPQPAFLCVRTCRRRVGITPQEFNLHHLYVRSF